MTQTNSVDQWLAAGLTPAEIADRLGIATGRCRHTGKIPLASEEAAEAVCEQLARKRPRYGPHVRATPYVCQNCGRWHVGRTWKGDTP
jgi:hypothetical protein